MAISRRTFIGSSFAASIAATCSNVFAFGPTSKGYIDPDWRKMVAMQRCDDGTYYTLIYSNDRGYGRLALTLMDVSDSEFIYDGESIPYAVKDVVQSFPHTEDAWLKRKITSVFDVRASCTGVAASTKRGPGNTNMYGSWYYRGRCGDTDAPFVVLHKEFDGVTRYAIVKHPHFEKYGFHMTEPVPDKTYAGSNKVYRYGVEREIDKHGNIFHTPIHVDV